MEEGQPSIIAEAGLRQQVKHRLTPGAKTINVVKRVVAGVYTDGFIHAGNLAYMALLTIFPFFIVAAAIAHFFGRAEDSLQAVALFLNTLPPNVADVLAKPISDVLSARSGMLLWLGGVVGLWTTSGFIETIRDILRRAYDVQPVRAFWKNRLLSGAITVVSAMAAMFAFTLQIILSSVERLVFHFIPFANQMLNWAWISWVAQALVLFPALFWLFYALTPDAYRTGKGPKWAGPLLVTFWWMATTALLPRVLSLLGGYSLTYGGLAGVIIVLLFFFVIGLGIVAGAELNAALAQHPEPDLKENEQHILKAP